MSNALAIAAATRTLRNLLTAATPNVTSLPLDKARDAGGADQLNVFLYQTVVAAAWRNTDPRQGDGTFPPLPLALHYLVTAYSDDEVRAHEVLGRAMSILHDHPVLGAQEISDATIVDLPDSDLHLQPERIRITPLGLSTDDLFKLWSGFQTNYRVSSAYELTVILIDSTRPSRTPLPVLRQGSLDRGPFAVPSPAPALAAVLPPAGAPGARLGDEIRLRGSSLDASISAVRFASIRLPAPIELPSTPATATERTTTLPSAATVMPSGQPANAEWAPGLYTVAVETAIPGLPAWVSNELPFGLAADITVTPLAAAPGAVDLTVTCSPRLRDDQRVLLLLGERQASPGTITTPADPTEPTTLTFHYDAVAAGTYLVRLRVDGVDSNPVVLAGTPPQPTFDANQQVVVS
jgi:hypothetical protein